MPKSELKKENPETIQATTYQVTRTVVVKRCLRNAINRNIPEDSVKTFLALIDQYTELISRMARRASVMLLYYIMRCHEDNLTIPDFDQKGFPDAYFKQLLRIGLKEFEGSNVVKIPTDRNMVEEAAAAAATEPVKSVKASVMVEDIGMTACFKEIEELLGTTLGPSGTLLQVPEGFDRILGHAAITFKTMFLNNLKVPFISKLGRLCKFIATDVPNANGFKILRALRNNDPLEEWPSKVKDFIKDARSKLGLGKDDVLYDDTPISSLVRMRFAWWQQKMFTEGNQRRNMMSPVFKVSRMNIRLDATSLYIIAWNILIAPQKPEVFEIKCPTKETHPDSLLRKKALVEWKQMSENYKLQKEEHKKAMENITFPSYSQLKNPVNPKLELDKKHKLPHVSSKKERPQDVSVDDWTLRIQGQKADRDKMVLMKKKIEESKDYKAKEADYNSYEKRVHNLAMSLFEPFQDKSLKTGWVGAASVVTDGVSLCVMYEKKITLTTKPPNKDKNKDKNKYLDDLEPKDDYDPIANTIVGNTLVLGVDPGRTQIVTIICIDADGKKHVWKLSRGQYYIEGGIIGENKRQTKRYKDMRPHFARLLLEGGSLRTDNSEDIRKYLVWYKEIQKEWWDVALSRAESRGKMQRYIGKKSVLATFFNKVKRDATLLLKASSDIQRIEVAYGSAVMSMPCTGRGEVAAPVGAAYKACKEAFGAKNVSQEWEYNTTKKRWETKKTKELVYKKFNVVTGIESLHHTSANMPPFVTSSDLEIVRKQKDKIKDKGNLRRGGIGVCATDKSDNTVENEKEKEKKEKKLRYTECRGLRFCTETSMYHDRDEASARAWNISRTKVFEAARLWTSKCFQTR
jgi:hypothetical protein